MSINNKKTKKGFTLIEIMVAISIFSIVMVIVIGALLSLNNANKKAQALRAVVDNLNFSIEDMTRNIKTGREYYCAVSVGDGKITVQEDIPCDKNTGYSGLIVKGKEVYPGVSSCYMYYFDTTSNSGKNIKYSMSSASKNREGSCNDAFDGNGVTNLVSPEVKINSGKFFVVQDTPMLPDSQQPIVIVNINGEIDVEQYKFVTPFNIQTTISQRSSTE